MMQAVIPAGHKVVPIIDIENAEVQTETITITNLI